MSNQKNNRPVLKTVPYVQETMYNAYGFMFSHAQKVKCRFRRNKKTMTVTCEANGIVAQLSVYEKQEGGRA